MIIKVIKDSVYHKSEILGIGSVITDLDTENAKRLCKEGYCEVVDNDDTNEAEQIDDEICLDEMTKKQLIEYAEQLGVEVSDKETKAQIIEKITQAVGTPATDFPTE